MEKILKHANCGKQNSVLKNRGIRLDFAHLRFRLVRTAA